MRTEPESVAMGAYVREIVGISILAGILLVELAVHGRQSRRIREYGFLLLAAAIGIVFCLAWDSVTFRISPAYFAYGKGLVESPLPLGQATAWLAVNVGWRVGLLVGAVFLFANSGLNSPPRLPLLGSLALLGWPIVAAIGVGVIGGAVFSYDPFGDWNNLPDLADAEKRRFLIVQGLHLGGYLGGAIGTGVAVRQVRQPRLRSELDRQEQDGGTDIAACDELTSLQSTAQTGMSVAPPNQNATVQSE